MALSGQKTIKQNGVTMTDYGQPEYLDGGRAQYYVSTKKGWAYFTDKSDAKAFFDLKAGITPKAKVAAK